MIDLFCVRANLSILKVTIWFKKDFDFRLFSERSPTSFFFSKLLILYLKTDFLVKVSFLIQRQAITPFPN
jgi:hypothetical protein